MIYIGLHHYFILVFFKWINNQEGTAGYVMVSATNERDVKLVQNIESLLKLNISLRLIFNLI
jgi:hypothetical protein